LTSRQLDLPDDAVGDASSGNFEVAGYGFDADREEVRPARVVRVGLIQNKIVEPTDAPILKQVF